MSARHGFAAPAVAAVALALSSFGTIAETSRTRPLQQIATVDSGPGDEQIEASSVLRGPAVDAAPPEAGSGPLRIALYGDSIGEEIYPYLAFFANSVRPVIINRNVYGGTNACDWFYEAERDARRFRPDIVITMFVGNDFTRCTRPADQNQTTADIVWRTVADTNALASLFATDVAVYRVGFARSALQQAAFDESGTGNTFDGIRYLLAVSSTDRLHYIDGSEVLLEDGRYTDTLPCSILDGTNCGDDGRIQVRAADGAHLCPAVASSRAGVINRCPVYSGGAARLAVHVLSTVLPTQG